MKLSKCCDALPAGGMEEYGVCGKCKEHCEFYDVGELGKKEKIIHLSSCPVYGETPRDDEPCECDKSRCENIWHGQMPHIDLRLIGTKCPDCKKPI